MISVTAHSIYTVKQLNGEIRRLLESSYRDIWLTGEISNLAKPASGHLYFSIREEDSIIRCAFFKNRQRGLVTLPVEGMQVVLQGHISHYEARGDLQFIVGYLEDAGQGALRRQFDILKRKLADEGLFDVRHKSPIPALPARIGIITAPTGAAVRDVLATLARRAPWVPVIVYPTLVQGESAGEEVANAIAVANSRSEVDVLILTRGGGSLEDLQTFNEERVARAVFASEIPVISAIGHEVDFSIADLAADMRAATPTAAAEIAVLDRDRLKQRIHQAEHALLAQCQRRLDNLQQYLDLQCTRVVHPRHRLEAARTRVRFSTYALSRCTMNQIHLARSEVNTLARDLWVRSPVSAVQSRLGELTALSTRIHEHVTRLLLARQSALEKLTAQVRLLGPQNTLDRGYAIVQDANNSVVYSADALKPREHLRITFAEGRCTVTVDQE